VYVGVTTIVATTGTLELFVVVKDGIFPVPEANNPILVWSFVQVYVLAVPVKLTSVVAPPLQTTKSVGLFTIGVGKIVSKTVR
jgi:hypothetical protein